MTFLHCYDEKLKDKLIAKGYKYIQEYQTTNMIVWVFEHDKRMLEYLVFSDEKKYFMSSRLNF